MAIWAKLSNRVKQRKQSKFDIKNKKRYWNRNLEQYTKAVRSLESESKKETDKLGRL